MRLLLLTCLLGGALAVPAVNNGAYNYLEKVGIPLATSIRAAEESGARGARGARVTGGSEATLGQFPSMGGLVITLKTGFTAACGSTLISATKLITAAHCWYDGRNLAKEFEVVLGSLTLFEGGTRVVTSQVRTHESYDPSTDADDLAVITIAPVTFDDNIKAISLPTGSLLNQDYVGTTATAAGWGMLDDASIIVPEQTLHQVDLQVTSLPLCQTLYGSKVTSQHLCVSGAGGKSICSGDTGGPLMILSGGRQVMIGIGSMTSIDGCAIGYPSVFTRVDSHITWIINMMYS